MRLARYLHDLVRQHPDFEALTQHLSITTFRYVPADVRSATPSAGTEDYLRRLNEDLLSRVERSGQAFLSNAVVGGKFALRACIVNFRTTREDIESLLPLFSRLGGEASQTIHL
jgi:glutamate/tyrosine decarboxylase-like PLP-dependent enzyme